MEAAKDLNTPFMIQIKKALESAWERDKHIDGNRLIAIHKAYNSISHYITTVPVDNINDALKSLSIICQQAGFDDNITNDDIWITFEPVGERSYIYIGDEYGN